MSEPPPPSTPAYNQAGFGGYVQNEPPLPPPPPKRRELEWTVRFDLLELVFGRVTGDVEYAFAGPFSVSVGPDYTFADPRRDRSVGPAKGAGVHGNLAYWIEGRPLRGYFLKAHAAYSSVQFASAIADVQVPATQLGLLFGSQSIYGGWFTLSGALGVVYDFQSQDRYLLGGYDSLGRQVFYTVPASGLFGNGFDLFTQLAIGVSF